MRCGRSRHGEGNDRDHTASYEGLDVTVEGFDAKTGKTTWSVPLGAAEAFMDEDVEVTAVRDSEVLVQAVAGPLIIDLARGSTRTPRKTDAFWCARRVVFEYRETVYFADGQSGNSWRGGTLLDPCAADGSPSSARPKRLPTSLGATVGDRTVVTTGRGVLAYDR